MLNKYVFFLLLLLCRSATCQVPTTYRFWENYLKNSEEVDSTFWIFWNSHEIKKKTLWEKLRSATQCFSWCAFEDSDDMYPIPFENVIDAVEDIVIDFVNFYIEYFSVIARSLYKFKILHLFFNPFTTFILVVYLFHKKIFKPFIIHLQQEFDKEIDDPDNCSTCKILKGNQPQLDKEIED